MDGGYKGWNPYIERDLAIFVNYFRLERTNQLNPLPDKDLVDLCPPYRTIPSNEEPLIISKRNPSRRKELHFQMLVTTIENWYQLFLRGL